MTVRASDRAAQQQLMMQQMQMQQPPMVPGAQQVIADHQAFGQVTQILAQNMSTFGDSIDMNDIYKAASTPGGDPQLQQAAQWMLQHPQYFSQLDIANKGGTPDANISGDDLKVTLGRFSREQQYQGLKYDPRLGQFEQSLAALAGQWQMFDTAKDGGNPDGNVSKDDIAAVISNPQAPPQLREAAQFLTSNPDLMSMLDTGSKGGDADGNISAADLQETLGQVALLRASMPQAPQPMPMVSPA